MTDATDPRNALSKMRSRPIVILGPYTAPFRANRFSRSHGPKSFTGRSGRSPMTRVQTQVRRCRGTCCFGRAD